MNKIIFNIFAFSIIIIALSSCGDIIEEPYTKKQFADTTTKNVSKKVLLEDFTGFTCGNCPAAGEKAAEIVKNNKGNVILVSVHAGPYAKPSSKHPYDFRTTSGTEYDVFFGISKASNPNGMINRKGYTAGQKNHIFLPTKWEEEVNNSLKEKAKIELTLNSIFNNSNNTAKIDISAKYLEDAPANWSLILMVIEDSVIQYQQDYRLTPPDVEDFVHMHVLRDNPLGSWGQPLSSQPVQKGTTINKSYNYTIPDGKDWKPKNLKIVAAIHDNGASYEILQVEEVSLIK